MTQSANVLRMGRRNSGRAQSDHILDPYQAKQKPREPSVCVGCNAVYHGGRWRWGEPAADAHRTHCPACRRIGDAMPAGLVTLHGQFGRAQSADLVALLRNVEAAENAEHPLNRIMAVKTHEDGLEISTTDIHLPRRIGTAIERAFHGNLNIHFDEAGYFVRVDWHSPAAHGSNDVIKGARS